MSLSPGNQKIGDMQSIILYLREAESVRDDGNWFAQALQTPLVQTEGVGGHSLLLNAVSVCFFFSFYTPLIISNLSALSCDPLKGTHIREYVGEPMRLNNFIKYS